MSQTFESQFDSLDNKIIRFVCPFFKYNQTPLFELFLEDETELKIKIKCHNHIMDVEEYFKYFLKNITLFEKKNSCEFHLTNNKYVAYCFSCSKDLCENCIKDRHKKDRIDYYPKLFPDEKDIQNEYNEFLNKIKILNKQLETTNLNDNQINYLKTIKYIFIILKIGFIEYLKEVDDNNFSYASIENMKYILEKSKKKINLETIINMDSIDGLLDLYKSENKNYLSINDNNNKPTMEFIKQEKIQLKKKCRFIAGNGLYLVSITGKLCIFSIKNQKLLHYEGENEAKQIKNASFHSYYCNIFLTSSCKEMKIWEIKGEKISIKRRINYQARGDIEDAMFIPNKKCSILIKDDKGIIIRDLENIFYNMTLNLESSGISTSLSIDGEILACYDDNSITIYNINDNKKLRSIKEECYKMFIRKKDENYNLIIINENYIDYRSVSLNDSSKNAKIYLPSNDSYYDNKYDFLYLFSEKIIILKIEKWSKITEINLSIFEIDMLNTFKNHFSLISEFIVKSNIAKNSFLKYSIFSSILYNDENHNNILTADDKFWNNIIKEQKTYNQEFSFKSNITNEDKIIKKKYLNIPEIEKELENNYKYSLPLKKQMAIDEFKALKSEGTLYDQFIALVKIIIKDNVTKDILKKYLLFLRQNYNSLKEYDNIESYNDEIKYYDVCFTKQELIDIFDYEKEKSEKDKLLVLLKYISDYKIEQADIKNFLSKLGLNEDNLTTFNQPIDFNNKELSCYMFRAIISLQIIKYEDNIDKIKKIQSSIKLALKMDIFHDELIYINEDKFSKLILIILRGQIDLITEYNLNLLELKTYSKYEKNELIAGLDKTNFFKSDVSKLMDINVSNIKMKIDEKDDIYNFSNFLLRLKNDFPFENYELYNLKKIEEHFEKNIDFDKLKRFMKKILRSNVIKEVYNILYEKKFKYPFDNEDEASNFVDKYVRFIYLKDKSAKGATNKFTLKTYIFLKKRDTIFPSLINNIILYKALYPSSFMKTFYHELNHNFYNNNFFQSNGSIPLSTPRKANIKEREGGKYFELLLFKQKLHTMNLIQAMYILNEKNYEKSLDDFTKGFISPTKEDLDISGEYSDLNAELSKLKINNENFEDYIIRTDDDEEMDLKDYKINVDVDDDILGFPRD